MAESDDPRKLAREKLLGRVSRRETSVLDAKKYLEKRGFGAEVVDALISEFCERKWLDDERYTRALIRDLTLRGKGPRFVIQKLREKGITLDSKHLEQRLSIEDMGPPETRAATVLERKFGRAAIPTERNELFKFKQKTMLFLVRRGFDFETATRVVQQWLVRDRRA